MKFWLKWKFAHIYIYLSMRVLFSGECLISKMDVQADYIR